MKIKYYPILFSSSLILFLVVCISIITKIEFKQNSNLQNIVVPFNPKFEDYNLSQTVNNYYSTSNDALKISHINKKPINHNRFKADDTLENLMIQAVALTGIPYRWGGTSPRTGFDCSGFIRYVFRNALGVNLPRTAAEMAHVGRPVPLNALQPGDLLLFDTDRGINTHIGMYVGQNRFIQAPQSGERIKISVLDEHYRDMLGRARRILKDPKPDTKNHEE